jgi:hypothetical protein
MSGSLRYASPAVVAVPVLAVPVAAHGPGGTSTGIAFPFVVASVVGAGLLGGGVVLVAGTIGRRRSGHGLVALLSLGLGGTALSLAVADAPLVTAVAGVGGVGAVAVRSRVRDADAAGCGVHADAALAGVALHRCLEGAVVATLYAADAALGLLGAAVVAVHAAAETAAVCGLYLAVDRRYAVGAVLVVQFGFVAGVTVGRYAVGGLPGVVETGTLAAVGGILVAVGADEGYRRLRASSRARSHAAL